MFMQALAGRILGSAEGVQAAGDASSSDAYDLRDEYDKGALILLQEQQQIMVFKEEASSVQL